MKKDISVKVSKAIYEELKRIKTETDVPITRSMERALIQYLAKKIKKAKNKKTSLPEKE
jgi:hypothetical protein